MIISTAKICAARCLLYLLSFSSLFTAHCHAHGNKPLTNAILGIKAMPKAAVSCSGSQMILLKQHHALMVVIDAGHGGEDFGAYSLTAPCYQEKYLNLLTAQILKGYLQQMGYRTIMTRTRDVFIALDKRAEFANLRAPKIFVSIHYNSAPSKSAEGIEVFYYRSEENKARTKNSQSLAESIIERVVQNTQAKSRGVKHGNFAVIRETEMPAVLVEGGFLTNDNEVMKIKDTGYVKRLAWGVAQGIQDFLSENE